ncbi:MAG: VOC family protein [Woeseiaceae bacterium]|nr:VOC family protein [Woeseiaceae bacterium]
MHRSQLAGFIIDCEGGDLDEAASFWGRALGYEPSPLTDPEDEKYRQLETGPGGLHIEVQRVDHPSRVHLDIETDDIEAEVQRLERLGAKRLGIVRTWCVMEAPTGHRFCVVRPQSAEFQTTAIEREGEA